MEQPFQGATQHIDENIVLIQKAKALEMLDGQVVMARENAQRHYNAERDRINFEMDRQVDLTKNNILQKQQQDLMALDQQIVQSHMGIEQTSQQHRMQIEHTALQLEGEAKQQAIARSQQEQMARMQMQQVSLGMMQGQQQALGPSSNKQYFQMSSLNSRFPGQMNS